MNAINKFKTLINSHEFLAYMLALVLSTLMLGSAPNSIAIVFFIFFSVRYFVHHKVKLKFELTLIIPMLLYLLFCLTLLWTVNLHKTIIGLERIVVLFLIPAIFILIPKFSKEQFSIVFKYFTISNIIYGLLFLATAIIRWFNTGNLEVFLYHNSVSILDLNAIYVSLIFSINIFFLLSKEIKKLRDKITILFFILLLLLLSSKTILFALLLSAMIYLFSKGTKWFNKTKILLITILVLFIVGISSFTVAERIVFEKKVKFNEILTKEKFGKVYPWTGSSIRLLQLRILKEQINEESIFWKGFGLFGSRNNIKARHIEFNTYPEFHNYNYHNQYAQILSESGIFGLSLFTLMLVLIFIKALKSKNFLFIMYCITFCLLFFTESLLWRQKGLVLFIMLYCLFSRISIEKQGKTMSL